VTNPQTVDITEIVGNAKLGRFHVGILILGFLMIFIDSFDLGSVNVAAPAILRAFHGEKSQMGVVFGAGYFGILIGCWVFGYVGDRWGRKAGSIWSILVYAVPAFIIPFANSLDQLVYLRFLAGIGLGGVMPTTLALLAETAPKRLRASFAMLSLFGFPSGTTCIGLVAAWLVPSYGFSAVFFAAGAAGLALLVILLLFLPESVQFLALNQPQSPALARQMKYFAPDLVITPETRFVVHRAEKPKGFAVTELFAPANRTATALLWAAYFFEGLTYITIASWLAVVLETAGLSPVQASLTFSYAASGGIVVSFLLMRPLDKFGPSASVVTALIAIASLVLLGMPDNPQWLIVVAAIGVHSFCSATHSSLNGTVGLFYPTGIRSNGVGWASGLGRIASIIGPIYLGYLLSWKLPLQDVLYIVAAPYLLLVLACLGLGKLYRKNFNAESDKIGKLEPVTAAE
jgi:AAHS family 4-hydroxybenzoate transporter-like MFS transporter